MWIKYRIKYASCHQNDWEHYIVPKKHFLWALTISNLMSGQNISCKMITIDGTIQWTNSFIKVKQVVL